jgi:AAA domain
VAVEIDLLPLVNATVTAPAGCGKTELIADALRRHSNPKPILVLTHTNAGVAALRGRLDKARVPSSAYRLSTIDGWAIRLISTFPARSGLNPEVLRVSKPATDYPAIRVAASSLLSGQHVHDVLAANYNKLIVDEYQDCTVPQHELVCHASNVLPTVILGDPLQAIFNWSGPTPDWQHGVCGKFPIAGELKTPWRWTNAGAANLGQWLLNIRKQLQAGTSIDLASAPGEVEWVQLDGTDDEGKRRRAALTDLPDPQAKTIILGDNYPATHRRIASQTPGAITVEAVDLRDLVAFAQGLDFSIPDAALQHILEFAGNLMTHVGANDVLQRVAALVRGTARTAPSDIEREALAFREVPNVKSTANLLSTISASPGVRTYRTGVLRSAFRALSQCDGTPGNSFAEAAIRVREQNRLIGRPLAKRSVGSTLLLKGLEAEVAVVLYADAMDARNLYVALTRGSKKLVVCSKSKILTPVA